MITRNEKAKRKYDAPLLAAAACVLGIGTYQSSLVWAHGIVSEDVVKIEQALKIRPTDSNLRMDYVGKLIAIAHYDDALKQVALLRKANPEDPMNDWLAATAQFEAGNFKQAHLSLTQYLNKNSDDGYGRSLNGRTLHALKKYEQAAEEFVAGINAGYRTTDTYLYAARAFAMAEKPKEAILILERGLSALGDLPVLYLEIASILHAGKEHLGAATRVQQMINTLPKDLRTESYYALKGDYLLAGGEHQQATKAYEHALTQLQQRDMIITRSTAYKELHNQLTAQLRRLNQPGR